jgi:hypothetical protein
LKRSHSTSSLRDDTTGSKDKEGTSPPPASTNGKSIATLAGDVFKKPEILESNGQIPETPLKKARGSGDVDVKSPARGLGFGQNTPLAELARTDFGKKVEFGGMLGGGMEMEEEIL